MGRIFVWAGEGLAIDGNGFVDRDVLVRMHHQSAKELKSHGSSVFEVPPGLSLPEAINWINLRAQLGDIALALEVDAFPNSDIRGTSIFYIPNNTQRRTQAEQLLRSVVQQVPSLTSRGALPDTMTETGSLAFTRQIKIPSLVLCLGFISNPSDKALIIERCYNLSRGITSGLILWSRSISERGTGLAFLPSNISLNGKIYSEQGILVEGNAYIPTDIIDQCAIDINPLRTARLLDYGGVTYIRAIDLREAGVFVGWDADTRTVLLQTLLSFKPEDLGKIIGSGYLLQSDYEAFLTQVNPQALQQFPDIAQLYQEEAEIEGVNPDIAFAQALLETNFFSFNSQLKPNQNNFGSLGSISGSGEFASFSSARIGVRAHIQRLKAYANEEPLMEEVVDPRFHLMTRGVASKVEQLTRRWSAKAKYGENILAILRRLYESAGLL